MSLVSAFEQIYANYNKEITFHPISTFFTSLSELSTSNLARETWGADGIVISASGGNAPIQFFMVPAAEYPPFEEYHDINGVIHNSGGNAS